MIDNTLTLVLEGDVTLTEFAESIRRFSQLLDLLSREVATEASIEWVLEDLRVGSAIVTAAGIADDESSDMITKVINAYEQVGEQLQRGENLTYSPAISREVKQLTQVIGRNKITAMRFETARKDVVLYNPSQATSNPTNRDLIALGSVRGRVQTISNRQGLKFTLYDHILDYPISCYMQSGQENQMLGIWGELAIVSGLITRDKETGRAKSVREITNIEAMRVAPPGSYRDTLGILAPSYEPAEVTIRRLRDAEDE